MWTLVCCLGRSHGWTAQASAEKVMGYGSSSQRTRMRRHPKITCLAWQPEVPACSPDEDEKRDLEEDALFTPPPVFQLPVPSWPPPESCPPPTLHLSCFTPWGLWGTHQRSQLCCGRVWWGRGWRVSRASCQHCHAGWGEEAEEAPTSTPVAAPTAPLTCADGTHISADVVLETTSHV